MKISLTCTKEVYNYLRRSHGRLRWSTYTCNFLGRFGGKKLERARDSFGQALKEVRVIILTSALTVVATIHGLQMSLILSSSN